MEYPALMVGDGPNLPTQTEGRFGPKARGNFRAFRTCQLPGIQNSQKGRPSKNYLQKGARKLPNFQKRKLPARESLYRETRNGDAIRVSDFCYADVQKNF